MRVRRFAYQNGQWFTTWLSHDLPKWTKEDHWFAPAILDRRQAGAAGAAVGGDGVCDDGRRRHAADVDAAVESMARRRLRSRCFRSVTTAESDPAVFVQLRLGECTGRCAIGIGNGPAAELPLLG